jgi:hypothetical protein
MIKNFYFLLYSLDNQKTNIRQEIRKLFLRPHQQFFNKQKILLESFLLNTVDEDPIYVEELRKIIHNISDIALKKILLSPEVTFQLAQRKVDKTFLKGAFEVEEIIEGHKLSLTEKRWSSLGDCYLKNKQLNKINNSLPLDFNSPLVSFDDQDSVVYNQKEQKNITNEINKSLALIKKVSPAIYEFIKMTTFVLQIRKNSKRTYSYSTENYIGRVFMTNPLELYKNVLGLAGGIFHEAIHNYLYIIERFEHLIRDRYYQEQNIVSPWTGNEIQTHSFMHAIFVWYGLWKLYRIAGHYEEYAKESWRRCQESSFGFRKNCKITEPLQKDFLSKVHPDFLEVAQLMQDEIKSTENSRMPEDITKTIGEVVVFSK